MHFRPGRNQTDRPSKDQLTEGGFTMTRSQNVSVQVKVPAHVVIYIIVLILALSGVVL